MGCGFVFFNQKTAYEMRISDWSSDVCSSDLAARATDHETRDVAQRGDRVVVVEVAAKAALVTQRRAPPHHRVAILVVADELQTRRFAADLVGRVVDVRKVLSLPQRQQPLVRVSLPVTQVTGTLHQRVYN